MELALNGIGGNSIETVKRNLSLSEIRLWGEYVRKRGSLNTGRRVEQVIGSFMALYRNSNRGKGSKAADPRDFMPHESKPEPQDLGSFLKASTKVGKV
ncbi:hypothetical protein APC39_15375 [Acinetobacter pittii]|uniref:hypothetical protein n=1 Tax=Acinetobacter pittii TaxID=48296 RepID=UPI0007080BA6|nr:hypothetical protein [Acinetobacter pittii]KQG36965.1 hypothetical protein APC39_15375 [Acinetobacter pittii]